jgi:signal transduction histidine kinase
MSAPVIPPVLRDALTGGRSADEAWLATLTVLYVEDDAPTRTQLARFLRRRVRRLVEASNGAEGLARFRADRPSLIVTDIEMPGMDGLSMADAIRRLDRDVPIVVTTAFEQVDYLLRSIDVGVDKYVTKPVDVDKLEAALLSIAHRLRAESLLAREHERERSAHEAHRREALGLLAGGMAHDFNNLLAAVLANVDLAASIVGPRAEASELLQGALEATRQAVELGRHLLTLSNGLFLRLRPGPIGPTLRRALGIAGSGLRVELPPELPPDLSVSHDPELLSRAFEQLVRNACEATASSGVLSVSARLRPLIEGEVPPLVAGAYLELSFRDSGPGIPADILPRIFDPYFTTKPRGAIRGMGLGLSLCLAIVRKHRGHVLASSPEGGGALFTVLLPTTAA